MGDVQPAVVERGVAKRIFINLNTSNGFWGQIRVANQQSDGVLNVTFHTDCEDVGYCAQKLRNILDSLDSDEVGSRRLLGKTFFSKR